MLNIDNNNNDNGCVELAARLVTALSDANVFSAIAHGYHWNVKGSDFKEFHSFFGDLYDDVSGSIDPLAEFILQLGYDAPYFLHDFLELSGLPEQERIVDGDPISMTKSLYELNLAVVDNLNQAFAEATLENKQGIANYLADRLGQHAKWEWQLRATLS